MDPESPVATVILVGVVTADPPTTTGLVTLQVKLELQLLPPEDIVQFEAVSVPDIPATAVVVNVPSAEYPVPVALVA